MNIKQIIVCLSFATFTTSIISAEAHASEYMTVCASSISDAKQIAWDKTGQSWGYESSGGVCGYVDGHSLYYYTMYR
jgi:hypothetical protein